MSNDSIGWNELQAWQNDVLDKNLQLQQHNRRQAKALQDELKASWRLLVMTAIGLARPLPQQL